MGKDFATGQAEGRGDRKERQRKKVAVGIGEDFAALFYYFNFSITGKFG